MSEVIPSNIQRRFSSTGFDGGDYSNVPLRIGEVLAVLYPDDPKNLSGKFVEYKVSVQQRSNRTAVTRVYDNCLLVNKYGSIADKDFYTLRADPTSLGSGMATPGKGAKVLIACINGETHNAVIIGGITDQTDTYQKDLTTSDADFTTYSLFNGIEQTINTDGELTITYKGKTKLDGTIDDSVDSDAPGSFLKLDKDGNIIVSDKDGKNAITIDHKNSKVVIARDSAFELGEATDKMLLGETYRNNENQLNQMIQQQMQQLQTLLMQAGIAINIASATPATPAGLAPVALAPAGAALIQAAQCASQIASAIAQFEAMKDDYLSKKNSSD